MADLLYPRTVKITRPIINTAVGAQPYSGLVESNESIVFTAVAAAIQKSTAGRTLLTNLPSDARHQIEFKILLPVSSAAFGTINLRDIVTDELGARYQVFAPVWTVFGYNLLATLMEV